MEKEAKADRLLKIYSQLADGAVLGKKELAQRFQVSERTVLRDIEALQCFLTEQGLRQEIGRDRKEKGYYLKNRLDKNLNNSEILAVCKILLESRSMRQEEMFPLLEKLVEGCVPPENKKSIKNLIANEKFHYVEPHHGQYILNGLWEIGRAVREHRIMEIQYERMKDPKLVTRKVEPVGIMFSEYYFYLTAFLRDIDREASFENPDDLFPTIYRIDRIRSFKVLEERFQVPYPIYTRLIQSHRIIGGQNADVVHIWFCGTSITVAINTQPVHHIDIDNSSIQCLHHRLSSLRH